MTETFREPENNVLPTGPPCMRVAYVVVIASAVFREDTTTIVRYPYFRTFVSGACVACLPPGRVSELTRSVGWLWGGGGEGRRDERTRLSGAYINSNYFLFPFRMGRREKRKPPGINYRFFFFCWFGSRPSRSAAPRDQFRSEVPRGRSSDETAEKSAHKNVGLFCRRNSAVERETYWWRTTKKKKKHHSRGRAEGQVFRETDRRKTVAALGFELDTLIFETPRGKGKRTITARSVLNAHKAVNIPPIWIRILCALHGASVQ